MPSDTKAAPHIKINTGSLKGSPPTLSSLARKDNQEPETLTNCALCTAAALTKQTSDQVNDELKIALPQSAQAFATYARKNVLSGTKENNAVFDYVAHKDLPQTEWEKLTQALLAGKQEILAEHGKDTITPDDQELRDQITNTTEKEDLCDQIIGLAKYVKDKLKTKVACSEWPADFVERTGHSPVNLDDMTHAQTAIPFMKTEPVGTKFAVYTTDGEGKAPHWSYAEKKTEQQIFFTDPQLDRSVPLPEDFKRAFNLPSGLPTASEPKDFPLGPNGTVYGSEPNIIYMFVLAFGLDVHAST
jgi:hypothetical protein